MSTDINPLQLSLILLGLLKLLKCDRFMLTFNIFHFWRICLCVCVENVVENHIVFPLLSPTEYEISYMSNEK